MASTERLIAPGRQWPILSSATLNRATACKPGDPAGGKYESP